MTGGQGKGRLKIAFVSFTAYPLFNPQVPFVGGGAEVQLYQAAGELAKDGAFEISFVVGDFGQPGRERHHGVEVVKGFRAPRRKMKFLSGLRAHWQFLRTLRRLDPDLCVQRAAGTETGLIAFYCRLFGKRFLYMAAHEIDCNGEFIRNSGWSGRYFRYGLEHADLVVVQNAEQALMMRERHGRETVTWRGGYPVPARKTVEADKKGYLLWVGRLVRFKQPELAIEVSRRFPGTRLVMIGQPSADARYAARIAEEARRAGTVDFIPGLSFREIDRYYREALLFLNTSSAEGFPNTFMQAAMHGTPIVSLGVNPDGVLDAYDCGLCARGDRREFAAMVGRLLENREEWRGKSANAYRYFLEQHDLGKSVDALKEIVGKVMAQKGRPERGRSR